MAIKCSWRSIRNLKNQRNGNNSFFDLLSQKLVLSLTLYFSDSLYNDFKILRFMFDYPLKEDEVW